MTDQEAFEIFERLVRIWPRTQIKPGTADEYVRSLKRFDQAEVHAAIDTLSDECQWLPSLAEIIDKLDLPAPPRRMTADQLHWSGHNPADFPDWILPEGPDDAGRIT